MATFNAKMINDVTRTPDTLMEGTYTAKLVNMSVRLAGKAKERVYLGLQIEGEAVVRRFELPLAFSATTNPQGADPRHIGLFGALLEYTKARPEKEAADGPSVFGYTQDGEPIHVALGKYEPSGKKNAELLVHIDRLEANDFQINTGRCDRANYVNALTEVQSA